MREAFASQFKTNYVCLLLFLINNLLMALYFKINASQETAWKQSTSVAVPSVCVQKREFKEPNISSNEDN